jgi:hypothetical protein
MKVFPKRKQTGNFEFVINEHIHYSQQVPLVLSACQLTSVIYTILNSEDTAHTMWPFACTLSKMSSVLNPLPPNDIYICHTALITSRSCILNIYSANIRTEYFKHAA